MRKLAAFLTAIPLMASLVGISALEPTPIRTTTAVRAKQKQGIRTGAHLRHLRR